jgi:hypothetical protein
MANVPTLAASRPLPHEQLVKMRAIGGSLQNERHQMSEPNYRNAGGTVNYP